MSLNKDSKVAPLTSQQREALETFVKKSLSREDGAFTPLHMKQCGGFLWVLPRNISARCLLKDFVRKYFPGENPNYAAAHPGWLEKYF